MKYICRLKMVPCDEELELERNTIHKIGLKHLVPISNCFNRRETFVAMQVPLKTQIASAEFRLDPRSWLDDLSSFREIHSLEIQRPLEKLPRHNIPGHLLTCFSAESHLWSEVCKEVFSDSSLT